MPAPENDARPEISRPEISRPEISRPGVTLTEPTQPEPQTQAQPDAHAEHGSRQDLRRADLGWRALLAVAAIVTAVAGAPRLLTGALVALALVLAVERLARSRREDAADSVLAVVGGIVVAVVLLGVALGALPIGLGATSWAVGLALVALILLGAAALLPRPVPLASSVVRSALKAAPWVVAAIAAVSIAIGISVRSIGPAEQQPLQLSFGQVEGAQVQVVVSSAESAGPLELRTTAENGNEISYPLFRIDAGRTYKTTLALPRQGRVVVSLNYPDQTQPLRSLTLDR